MITKVAGAYSLSAAMSNDAQGGVLPGKTIKFTVHYSWMAADAGSHAPKISLNWPSSLTFVNSSVPGSSTPVGVTLQCEPFSVNPFGSGSSGSRDIVVTLRFAAGAPPNAQACVSGSIFEGATSSNIPGSCVVLLNTAGNQSGGSNGPFTINLSATASLSQQVKANQPFQMQVHYAWTGASAGQHAPILTVTLPSSLSFAGANKTVSGPTNAGVITYNAPAFTSNTGGSGSGDLILTLKFKPNTPAGTQACLTGTIKDQWITVPLANSGNMCPRCP